ncbi:hypothetical protein H6P81_019390 [Aristolochia fimbriata]|uniref:Rab3GAP catalytic subunit conserved domain-containing protein n=1 Tax=Aristolochia fimbriata TaxID=158543 RepID=A0AAV7DT39_ARIFI|nr:hypothetical protein H6P81_019390 [Aristolochia fimbriata]
MESSSSSLVFRAKTAFHSAAAKAEKVFTDIKADLKNEIHREKEGDGEARKTSKGSSDNETLGAAAEPRSEFHLEAKHTKWDPRRIGQKQDWSRRLKNMKKEKQNMDEKEKAELSDAGQHPFISEDQNPVDQGSKCDIKGSIMPGNDSKVDSQSPIPPATLIKQLAVVVEVGKKFRSMSDVLMSARDSERSGISFSSMKSLVLRDKEDKAASMVDDAKAVISLIHFLFDVEEEPHTKACSALKTHRTANFPREVHGASPESFVFRLSKIMANFKSLRKMAFFWQSVIEELKRHWSQGQPVPRVPLDEIPDLNYCLLHQQLQVINCCIARKRRRQIAIESLESVIEEENAHRSTGDLSRPPSSTALYARTGSGHLALRLGASHQSESLAMLETGEPVFSPVVQEAPLLTEDLIRENEEFVLRTGSVGAGCSQLLSDMQAFKAANPGCILEDFIRWHSPPDWAESESSGELEGSSDSGDSSSRKGRLSSRMQKEGNLWRELWETAKPLPAVKQTPLFDEDLAVEGILNFLEEIAPAELFEQLFISLLSSGIVIAESALPTDSKLSKLFCDCKEYAIAICQADLTSETIVELCQVYETVETIIAHPDDSLGLMKQSEESTKIQSKSLFGRLRLTIDEGLVILPKSGESNREPKAGSGKFSLKFSGRPSPKEHKKSDLQDFSNGGDVMTSPSPRPEALPFKEADLTCLDDEEWTILI